MSSSPVRIAHDDDVAVLTLDDGKVNALNASTLPALAAALPEVADAAALVVMGRPGHFSAGFDLKALPAMTPEARREVVRCFSDVCLALFTWPRPVVVALTGHALAGGAVIAFTGDCRLLADGPYLFGFTEVAIGIPLPRFILDLGAAGLSPPAQVELLLHARRLPPAEAAARGVAEVVPPDQLGQAAIARARELGRLPSLAYGVTKERMRGAVAQRWRDHAHDDITTLADLVGRTGLSRPRS